jgi:hypothetical protein
MILDFADGGANRCMAAIANGDENSINLAFYPYAVGDACSIKMYDENYTLLSTIGSWQSADAMCYATLDSQYFPQAIESIYIRYESQAYTSPYIEFAFIASVRSYQYNMMTVRDSDIKYRVFFKKSEEQQIEESFEQVEQSITETNNNVQGLSDTVQQAVNVNEALIENLTTNLTKYALRPRVTHRPEGWEWTDYVVNPDSSITYTPCFSSSSSDKIRNYINIEDVKIKFLTEELTEPANYSKIDESDTSYLTVNGKQIYYMSLDDLSKGFTTISPKNFDKTITSHVEDMYKCRKLKAVGSTEWNIEIFQTISSSTSGGSTVLNKVVGINFDSDCKIDYNSSTNTLQTVITNTTDNKPRGIKMSDDGVYYTQDGTNWILIGTFDGVPVRIIDHTPTTSDVSGEDCVFVEYDPTATPIVTTTDRQILSAANTYVEVEYIPPEPLSIEPASAAASLGGTVQFTSNYQDAVWSVNSQLSSISATGLLSVSASETATELTVTATSATAPSPGTATATVTIGNHESVLRSNFNARLTELWRQYYGEYASQQISSLNYPTTYLQDAKYVEVYWGTNPATNNSFMTLAYDANGNVLQRTGSQGQLYTRFNHSGSSNANYNTAAIGATLQITIDIYD